MPSAVVRVNGCLDDLAHGLLMIDSCTEEQVISSGTFSSAFSCGLHLQRAHRDVAIPGAQRAHMPPLSPPEDGDRAAATALRLRSVLYTRNQRIIE
mmetsp:Transcript_61854/g.122301  ORF Transcript_61854/g.122301 Transcript_61854/m.122301 type:complete len:96 (-) Transcript_61854:368-655(-)